jgi:DNA-binding transcriptional regulator YiaG
MLRIMSSADLTELARARDLSASGMGRLIRQRAKVSHREVAASIGTSASAVYRWETGERVPRTDKGLAWARAMWQLMEGS